MDNLFFIASKLMGAAFRIETLFILLLGAGLVSLHRRRTRSARRAFSVTLVSTLALTVLPLGHLLLAPLELRYPANPQIKTVSTIIVLGGAEETDYSARWRQPNVNAAGDRYIAAISLARRFPESRILFAGGSSSLAGSELSEASIARDIFRDAGITDTRLRFEDSSRNTAENAALLRNETPQPGSGVSLLVTSAFHMQRAMATFCAAGWTNLVAWPTDYRTSKFRDGIGWNFAENLANLNTGIKEWIGLLIYRLTGRTRSLLGADCAKAPTDERQEPVSQSGDAPDTDGSASAKAP